MRQPQSFPVASILGAIGCAGFLVHAGYHFSRGTPQDAIWVCHVSALLVGVGLIVRSAWMNAAGLLCLTVGFPMWVLSLVSGEPFIPTSPLTHVLGLVLGVVGARMLGLPKYAWLAAVAFVLMMMTVSRLITPIPANVNLAFRPMEGLSLWNTGGVLHWVFLLGSWALWLLVFEIVWRRVLTISASRLEDTTAPLAGRTPD